MSFNNALVFEAEDRGNNPKDHRNLLSSKCHLMIINGNHVARLLGCPVVPGSMRPRIRFGPVGRMTPVKGGSILLLAFAELGAGFAEAGIPIVGGRALFDELSAHLASGTHWNGIRERAGSRISEFF